MEGEAVPSRSSLRPSVITGLLLVFLTSHPALPENTTNTVPSSLTVDQCIERAMAVAEEKGLFDRDIAFARTDLDMARARSYPHLNITPEARYYVENSDLEGAFRADLGHHFLEIPQNRLRRRIARNEMMRAQCRADRLRCVRTATVIRAYVDCLSAGQDQALVETRLRAAAKANGAWRRVNAQTQALIDKKEASARAVRDARSAVERAELRHSEARRQLGQLCGLQANEVPQLTALPGFEMPPVSLDDCLSWAAAHRSDLAATRHELTLTTTTISLARMARFPTPGLSFGYTDREQNEFEDREGGPFATVQLRVPVWDAGEVRARVRRLEARRKALDADSEELESATARGVATAFLALRTASQSLEAAQTDQQPLRRFQAAEVRFRSGRISSTELDVAHVQLAEHETAVLHREWDCFRARADLLAAIEATPTQLSAGLQPPDAGASGE